MTTNRAVPNESLKPQAWLGLMSLPSFGARRLWSLHENDTVRSDWQRLVAGDGPLGIQTLPSQRQRWVEAARLIDPIAIEAAHHRLGIVLTTASDDTHPVVQPGDPHVPPALLWRGLVSGRDALRQPVVGIIGTRRASRYGVDLASNFARELVEAGCCIGSGLASGIDAAAHRGALSASSTAQTPGRIPALAVVGSGHDVVYPKANRALWGEVAQRGVIVSEYPLGTPPAAWRFPERNRILAALCDVLVVVESHERGGSLITAGVAGARGVPVLAVPGAIHSDGSRGTNRLISDGCQPCLGVQDIFDALTLMGQAASPAVVAPPPPGEGQLPFAASTRPTSTQHEQDQHEHDGREQDGRERDPSPSGKRILDQLGWTGHSLSELAERCPELGVAGLVNALEELQSLGRVTASNGLYEQRLRGATGGRPGR